MRTLGLDNLAPIIWYKISNGATEATGNGAGYYGKPYQPNGVIKNDVEYILFFRKGGEYRRPSHLQKALSMLTKNEQRAWFQQIWSDIRGASTREGHPAPYPIELAARLIRMFSFAGDTVLDPFVGTGTTTIAAIQQGRHSIGNEVDHAYFDLTIRNVMASAKERSFSGPQQIDVEIVDGSGRMAEVGIPTVGRI
jgi:site-specific DNA-methyltransferase (adenine-specific)